MLTLRAQNSDALAANANTEQFKALMPDALRAGTALGMGRELFSGMRRNAITAEEGACSWL